MDLIFSIINMVLAFYCAFTAGKFNAAITIDREILNKVPPKSLYFWMIANAVISIYFIITIFGSGIRIGAL